MPSKRLPAWKRRVWRGRALHVAGYVAAALVFGYAGWNAAGLRAMDSDVLDGTSTAWPRETVRTTAVPTAERGDGVRRYHLTAWTEIEGMPVLAGEAYVESPHSMRWQLKARFENAVLEGQLVVAAGLSPRYSGFLSLSRTQAVSPRGLAISEHGMVSVNAEVMSGSAALVTLFADMPGPRPMLRIEGPFAAPPTRNLHWQQGSEGTRYANSHGWLISNVTAFPERQVRFRLERTGETATVSVPSMFGTRVRLPGAGYTHVNVWVDGYPRNAAQRRNNALGERLCVRLSYPVTVQVGQRRAVSECTSTEGDRRVQLDVPGVGRYTARIDR